MSEGHDHDHQPVELQAVIAMVRAALAPTVEIEIRGGKIYVQRKDFGVRLVIRDYDEHQDGAYDVFEPAEHLVGPAPAVVPFGMHDGARG